MRQSTRETLRSAAFEAAFVVLGVALALAANEWRESIVHRRQGAAALREIHAELRANRDAVRESLSYHGMLVDSIAAHGDGPPPGPSLFARGFVSPAQLSRTAWESASETGALSHVDYATVLLLSRVYARQERYEDQSRTVGEVIYAELLRGGPRAIAANHRNLVSLVQAFAYRERELLGVYREALPADSLASVPGQP